MLVVSQAKTFTHVSTGFISPTSRKAISFLSTELHLSPLPIYFAYFACIKKKNISRVTMKFSWVRQNETWKALNEDIWMNKSFLCGKVLNVATKRRICDIISSALWKRLTINPPTLSSSANTLVNSLLSQEMSFQAEKTQVTLQEEAGKHRFGLLCVMREKQSWIEKWNRNWYGDTNVPPLILKSCLLLRSVGSTQSQPVLPSPSLSPNSLDY